MCTKPLKGFKYGETKNGKPNYIITSGDCDHIEVSSSGAIVRCFDHFVSDTAANVIWDNIPIPCGKCLECRLEYARQWADRCMLEAQDHKENSFITLTYDDDHIPTCEGFDPVTGEQKTFNTLCKRDLQLFMKSLREHLRPDGILVRFYASGEYGEQFMRPHYHISLFGWIPKDLKLYKMSNMGYCLYKSDELKDIWKKGDVIVSEMTWDTCNYVARYQVKKLSGTLDDETRVFSGIQKEFVTMSRRPGIGLNWYLSHDVCYAAFLNQYLKGKDESIKISPNRYFDSYLEKTDPERLCEIKEVRKHFQEQKKKIGLLNSSLSYQEILDVKDYNLKAKTKILKGEL